MKSSSIHHARSLPGLCVATTMFAIGAFASAEVPMPTPSDYEGLRVVEIDVPDEAVLKLLQNEGMRGLACTPTPGEGPWLLDADGELLLESLGLDHEDIVADLPAFISRQNAERRAARAERGGDFYADFRTLAELNDRLDQMAADHPDLVTEITIGTSHENRPIRGLVIRSGADDGRPAVFFNGCQHAREWISPMTTIYLADTLLDAYGNDPAVTSMLQKMEVVVIPVSNPDGYYYTYAPGGDRYWRKNRRVNGSSCAGVDLNRNWGSDWNGGQSTSNDPCSDIYVGPSSMSEPEVDALANYMLAHGNIKAQVDFHAYSQLILEPRGYTTVPPSDFDELHELGGDMSDAIAAVHGKSYVHDNPCNILYCASGTLIDWPYDTYGSRAYCIELRPGSGDPGGFAPPPSEIQPCAEENYQAVLTMMEWVGSPFTIELPSGPPSLVWSNDTTTFPVRITARSEDPVPGTARIAWRGDGGSYTDTSLNYLGGEEYSATLPAFSCDSEPEFFLVAEGLSGSEVSLPGTAPTDTFSASPVSDLVVSFDDDCETDLGWEIAGSATDGFWDIGIPVGGGDRGDAPNDADGSGSCWQTDNVDGNSDVDNGEVILTSPTMDATGDGNILSYSRWFSNSSGAAPGEDTMVVEASDNGGLNWVVLEIVGPTGTGTNGGWNGIEHDLDSVAGLEPSSNFRVRFIVEDVLSGSVVEAAVDGVNLSRSDCVEDNDCVADVVPNGVVDVADVLAILAEFGNANADFDLDGSGFVDVADILIVIASWGDC
ncbi:MAG: M14 family zinc carboxypeptidase [Phycisphaerales bacterium]|nr:M14 family zinc carboxypeptidase [Phycisphaerales bacterium]